MQSRRGLGERSSNRNGNCEEQPFRDRPPILSLETPRTAGHFSQRSAPTTSSTRKTMVTISEDGANQVVCQLLRQGYFETDDRQTVQPGDCGSDDFESYQNRVRRHPKQGRPHPREPEGPGPCASTSCAADPVLESRCQRLIPSVTPGAGVGYYTPGGLARHLLRELGEGRSSLGDLCRGLGVDLDVGVGVDAETERPACPSRAAILWEALSEEAESRAATILGGAGRMPGAELVSDGYWKRILTEIAGRVEAEGSVPISDLANSYALPRDELLCRLGSLSGSSGTGSGPRLVDDSKRLVSERYLRSLRETVVEYFAGLREPTQIVSVCEDRGWEPDRVLEWLADELRETARAGHGGSLRGEIHADGGAGGRAAVYLPTSYRHKQQQEILEFVAANGYLAVDRAVRNYPQGLLPGQIRDLVEESFPGVVGLGHGPSAVLVTESTLQQAKASIEDFLSCPKARSESLDLGDCLPAHLTESPALVSGLLERIGFASSPDGVAVIEEDRAIVVGNELVQLIKDRCLPRLVQEYGKDRAASMFRAELDGGGEDEDEDDENDEGKKTSRKAHRSSRSKRKARASKQSTHRGGKPPKAGVSAGVVPLSSVAAAVVDAYPSFLEENVTPDDVRADTGVDWEGDPGEGQNCPLVLYRFCREVLYSEALLAQCSRAVDAELVRLRSEKTSKAKLSRRDAAAKVRTVEAAFQDAFVALCYLIQAQAKFLAFAENCAEGVFDEASMERLRDEFLRGPCADLTSRITQHCLFQEEAGEDCLFTFSDPSEKRQGDTTDDENDDNDDEEPPVSNALPQYCAEVDIAARRYPRSYLSSPPPREPLPVLRESFSGNTGTVLAKTWVLCGGHCYRGGVRPVDRDDRSRGTYVRPGSVDGFLSYVEENCLVLCGLPFRKLDKKAEKALLFSRKRTLTDKLANADADADPAGVLEGTVAILFQQARNLVASGSLLRGPILEALCGERKIPSPVAFALRRLKGAIDDPGAQIDDELVAFVKEFGLTRDIHKYDTAPLEAFLAKQ
ncbi:unnamed protein product [Pseudo-nitzschia multistriata]|uniref:E3 UFM1-protein ligase 1-like N-terminal domain-containing protein n=1 Tax=Pseudo-nitzschia multistriata TaxID=183589 RepID=A0A448Z5K2_9STRA|nr:unnamed protein product [Pseudo-nitzschia multistriata]